MAGANVAVPRRRRRVDENQGDSREDRVTEGRVESVPRCGAPHLEPLATDCDETAEEQRDDHQQSDARQCAGPIECASRGERAEPGHTGQQQYDRRQAFPDDHTDVGHIPHGGVGQRPPHDVWIQVGARGATEVGGVHRQDVLDEGEVGAVVGDVAYRNEEYVEGVTRHQYGDGDGQGTKHLPPVGLLGCRIHTQQPTYGPPRR